MLVPSNSLPCSLAFSKTFIELNNSFESLHSQAWCLQDVPLLRKHYMGIGTVSRRNNSVKVQVHACCHIYIGNTCFKPCTFKVVSKGVLFGICVVWNANV